MVNPGGTGSLSTDVISARLAPLPPRRSLSSMGGWACVWSKSKTNDIGPPCPVRAHCVASAVHAKWLPSQPGTGVGSLLSFRRSSGAAGSGACSRVVLAVPGPGVACHRAGDVALEDLL